MGIGGQAKSATTSTQLSGVVSAAPVDSSTMYDPVENSLARLTIPDVLTPMQYYGRVRSHGPETDATKRLMLAVLEDALRCLHISAEGRRPADRRATAEAESWIFVQGLQGPFAFESICETLGIQPDYLRAGIRKWRAQSNGLNPP